MGSNGDRRLRFGDYELDSSSGKLLRDGWPVKIQPQPLRVLAVLAEHQGEIVSREQLRARIWGDSTFVEFDDGLNYCIRQIRVALGDDASHPRYVETLPKQGYRFIGELQEDLEHRGLPSEGCTSAAIVQSRNSGIPSLAKLALGGAILILFLTIGLRLITSARSFLIPNPMHVARVTKLTSYPGDEREPAISPDGSYVAFSWSGPSGNNYDIYVMQAGGGQQPLRLTQDPSPDSFPAWSPDDRQIAFIRREGASEEIFVVPPLGGPERLVKRISRIGADLGFSEHPVLNWSQDGKWIVFSGQAAAGSKYQLFLLSIDTGAVRAISFPNKDVIGDSSPMLSPDAMSLAFVRYLAPYNGRLLIQPLSRDMTARGEPTELRDLSLDVHSPVWLDDGNQLLFADATHIFHWNRKTGAVPVYVAGGFLGGMSVGPKRGDSRQIIVASNERDSDIWSMSLDATGSRAMGPPAVFVRSTEGERQPDFSPDGRHIVFVSSRSGAPEVWVCDADGSNLQQLTHLGAHVVGYPKWSPDGTRIAFHARVPDIAEVYVVNLNQGGPRQITHENPGLALPTWSNDGRFLYASTLVGGTAVTYRFPAEGGAKERLWEGSLPKESVDGKYILYQKTNTSGIFRRPLEGNSSRNPEELLIRDFWANNQHGGYTPVAGGIYYVSDNEHGEPGPFRFFDYGSRKSINVAPAIQGLGLGLAISPGRRRMLFSANAQIGGDLLSLELR